MWEEWRANGKLPDENDKELKDLNTPDAMRLEAAANNGRLPYLEDISKLGNDHAGTNDRLCRIDGAITTEWYDPNTRLHRFLEDLQTPL